MEGNNDFNIAVEDDQKKTQIRAFVQVIAGYSAAVQRTELNKAMTRRIEEANDMRISLERKKLILHNERASLGFFMMREKRELKTRMAEIDLELNKVPSEQSIRQEYQSQFDRISAGHRR